MEWEQRQREQAHYYTAVAKELRQKLEAGYLKELTPYRQFIVRKHVYNAGGTSNKSGTWQEQPYNPHTHRLASPTDPNTWGTIEEALHALASGVYTGLSFVFTPNDPFMGITLPSSVHDNHRINYREERLIRQFNSYTEYAGRNDLHCKFGNSVSEISTIR